MCARAPQLSSKYYRPSEGKRWPSLARKQQIASYCAPCSPGTHKDQTAGPVRGACGESLRAPPAAPCPQVFKVGRLLVIVFTVVHFFACVFWKVTPPAPQRPAAAASWVRT